MNKIIFEISETKETPRTNPKLNIQINFEPMKQDGKAKELADRIIHTIDEFVAIERGDADIIDIKKY